MVASSYVPSRGDVMLADLSPTIGHEQSGRRPVLVLTPQRYNRLTGLAVVCPLTNREKGYGFEVPLPHGLKVNGVILADQVKSLDWRHRNIHFLAALPADFVHSVASRVASLLGVPQPA